MDYTLEVAAEPGGVRVSVNLDKPLPEKLAGRAGFNLEFLPSIYMGKTYTVDNTSFGVFPRVPRDPMIKVMPLPDEPKKLHYQEDWDKAKGYTQPLPFAQGKAVTMAVDDPLARVTIKSDTGRYSRCIDGRNRAQNGWFVLRTLIPAGQNDGRRGLAHPAGRDSELDAAADGRAQPGGLCAGLPEGRGDRTRPEVRRSQDGQVASPGGRWLLQARCSKRRFRRRLPSSATCTRSSTSLR